VKIALEFEIDVRNSLYLLEEQGADVSALKARLEALEKKVARPRRGSSVGWQRLAADTLRAVDAKRTPEPSELRAILRSRPRQRVDRYTCRLPRAVLADKVSGGWHGRVAGCILGKPVECLMKHHDSRAQLKRILQESGEYPISDFISRATMVPYWKREGTLPQWFAAGRGNDSLREYIRFAPADDDLNYTVLALDFLSARGARFTPDQVLDNWHGRLPFHAVATAEKLAYRNRAMGLAYPATATFLNPYCEWIGAQIRADAYGYAAPGRPQEAAAMAWADAAASHVKNGIYGALWVAAAIAAAYVETDPHTIVLRGLEQVPHKCRFTEHMLATLAAARSNADDFEKTFEDIESRLGHYHCVHAVNNACVVAAALVHGRRDFGRTISIAVMGGLDTDCNGATAGSIAGVMLGGRAIPARWKRPFRNTLHTSIVGRGEVKITALVRQTLELIGRLGR